MAEHDPNYPPSPEYLARQAERQKKLDFERERRTWTDAQFLAERDAAYIAEQRSFVEPLIADIERDMMGDTDFEGYMQKYGTERV